MALKRPIGKEISDDPAAMTIVPQTRGRMPYLGGSPPGLNSVPVRKLSTLTPERRKKAIVSVPRTMMIPAVVSTVITAQSRKNTQTPVSLTSWNRELTDQSSPFRELVADTVGTL